MVEDEPQPELDELQQREIVAPVVPVKHVGAILVQELPSRSAPIFSLSLTTDRQCVVSQDLSRRRVTIIADQDFNISKTSSGNSAPWYAKVPLTLQHCDSLYAYVDNGTAELTVIVENWAD